MSKVLRVALLTAIWVALWSDISYANVASGALVAGVIVMLFDRGRSKPLVARPVRAIIFFGFVAYQLVVSTLVVAKTVLRPRDRIRTGIVAVPLRGCSPTVATVIADAITLTPGTLTVEVSPDPLTLYVHALDTRDVESVRQGVRQLEVLAVRAFGDAAALEGITDDDSSSWSTS